eukprot:6692075-Heterocapsa_arctica.AAC.1
MRRIPPRPARCAPPASGCPQARRRTLPLGFQGRQGLWPPPSPCRAPQLSTAQRRRAAPQPGSPLRHAREAPRRWSGSCRQPRPRGHPRTRPTAGRSGRGWA